MNDPVEEVLVEQAARDAIREVRKMDVAGIAKFIKSGNDVIRIRVSLIKGACDIADNSGKTGG